MVHVSHLPGMGEVLLPGHYRRVNNVELKWDSNEAI